MQELTVDEVHEHIKKGNINYYQFYNLDLDISKYLTIKYYLEYQQDSFESNQPLNILFLDIEVYNYKKSEDFESMRNNASAPISSITFYSTFEKIYHVYCLVLPNIRHLVDPTQIEQYQKLFKDELLKEQYIFDEENIKLYFFFDENKLIEQFWNHVHMLDCSVWSGFNADQFDIPYIYDRAMTKYKDEEYVGKLMSKFGFIKKRYYGSNKLIQIPEYPILDIRHLYIPRDEGGLAISSH